MKSKSKKSNVKKNNISTTNIILIGLAIIIILVVLLIAKFNSNSDEIELKEPIYMGKEANLLAVDAGYVFQNYDDFITITHSSKLNSTDFEKNNYVLVSVVWDGCGEDKLIIEGYAVNEKKVDFKYTYEARCGLCAPIYDYYLVPVDKSVTSVELNVDARPRNRVTCDPTVSYKPMIYLYPTKKTDVTVKLGYPELLTTTYPKYNNSWEVTAYPNGDLVDKNNKTYYGLYWEGYNSIETNFADGFVVKAEDTIKFLEEKLSILGLTEREANEFIIYWLPILEQNKYNLIRFESIEEINNQMPLIINPTPDSIIRVLMEYKPLNEEIKIKEQTLTSPQRTGFTVVEWGGTMLK